MGTYRLDGITMPDGNSYDIEQPCFVAQYGHTTYDEIFEAFIDGKALLCVWGDVLYTFNHFEGNFIFTRPNDTYLYYADCSKDEFGATVWRNSYYRPHAYPMSTSAITPSSSFYIAISSSSGAFNRSTIVFGSSTTKYLSQKGTWENVPSVPSAATATPSDLGTAAVGSSAKYAKEDHVHNKPTYSASDVGAIAAPSSPTVGDFLVYTSNGWAAQSLSTWQGGNY